MLDIADNDDDDVANYFVPYLKCADIWNGDGGQQMFWTDITHAIDRMYGKEAWNK